LIWLTWRQFRGSALAIAGALVVLAVTLAATGPGMATTYSSGIAACTTDGTCDRFFDRFFQNHELPFIAASLLVLLLPALIGLFWGAPLITRELEADTHLLVWNQSITRSRWLAVKLAVTGMAATAAAGVCGLVVTWWSDPLDKSAPSGLAMMDPLVFAARGIAPMGYAAFAFVLGVTVGLLVRRTLPAMALTLVVFAAFQLAVPQLLRAHLMPPVTATFELTTVNVDGLRVRDDGSGSGLTEVFLKSDVPGHIGAWGLSSVLLDPSGHRSAPHAGVPVSTTSGPCAPQAGGMAGCLAEISRLGYRQQATFQPLARFWPLQWIETGLYALLTVGLACFCFWRIGRRPS